jgi:hypothetical protein
MPEVRLARQLPPALLGDMPLSSLGFDIACVCAVAEVRREFGLGCVERPIHGCGRLFLALSARFLWLLRPCFVASAKSSCTCTPSLISSKIFSSSGVPLNTLLLFLFLRVYFKRKKYIFGTSYRNCAAFYEDY